MTITMMVHRSPPFIFVFVFILFVVLLSLTTGVDGLVAFSGPSATRLGGRSENINNNDDNNTDNLDVDAQVVHQQLGYLPPNYFCVSARTRDGDPIAIQTYPLHGGAPRRQKKAVLSGNDECKDLGTPFPTLYWLTNPTISSAIAELERAGYVQKLRSRLEEDPVAALQLLKSHRDYAARRWASIRQHDRELLQSDTSSSVQRMRSMLQSSGIAGTDFQSQVDDNGNFVPTLKCLHANYAHFRSVGVFHHHDDGNGFNPVGMWVHELLQEQFPEIRL